MKFKILKLLLFIPILLGIIPLSSCENNENKLVIAEVTHSIFYAPMYVAKNKGFFKDEGLDVEIVTTPGADKVMASLLSKDASIGLMGPEASIYVYENGQDDYAVNFAQLTQKDGSFLLGREKVDNFDYSLLQGSTIIGGRKGGMPLMILEYILRNKGIEYGENDPTKSVNIRTDVSFDASTGVFVSGESDYVTAFEPVGTQIEKMKKGYILTSLGQDSGIIPYTAFSCLKSYLENNEDKLVKFTKAIIKALDYVNNEKIENIIHYLKDDFLTSDDEELTSVMNNYLSIETWPSDPLLKEEYFNKLVTIIKESNELDVDAQVPYDKLVTSNIISKAK